MSLICVTFIKNCAWLRWTPKLSLGFHFWQSQLFDSMLRAIVIIVICSLFTHGALRSSQELVEKCPCIPDWIGIWKCRFSRKGKNCTTLRKTSWSKEENQQQTQPTYGVDARIRTWATLVGGECSHHCATFAPPYLPVMSPHANGTRHLSHWLTVEK